MSTQTQTEEAIAARSVHAKAETAVGFAVLGCLVAGSAGILKAMSMETGSGVLLCLLGSVVAFGMVYYIYFGKE